MTHIPAPSGYHHAGDRPPRLRRGARAGAAVDGGGDGHHLTDAPILEPDDSNRQQVMHAVAAMMLGRSATVLHVEVRITERAPDGAIERGVWSWGDSVAGA